MQNQIIPKASPDTCPELVLFTGHSNDIVDLAFSLDCTTIASLSYDQSIIIWDTITGEMIRKITGLGDGACCLAYSPDGSRIAVSDWDGIKSLDPRTGEWEMILADSSGEIAFLPNGSLIANTADTVGVTQIKQICAASESGIFTKYEDFYGYSFVVSSDGAKLAVTDMRDVRVQDLLTGCVYTLVIPPALLAAEGTRSIDMTKMALSPDGNLLAGVCWNATRVWDTETGKYQGTLRRSFCDPESVAFSPDGRILACGWSDGIIQLYNINSWKCEHQFEAHKSWARALAFSNDGNMLASGGSDNMVKLWNSHTGLTVMPMIGHKHGVTSAAFCNDCKSITSAHSDDTNRIWNLETSSLEHTCETSDKHSLRGLIFSPCGKIFAVPYDVRSGVVALTPSYGYALVNAETGEIIHILSESDPRYGHEEATSAVFSSDGRILAIGHTGFRLTMWDVKSGKRIHSIRTRRDSIGALAFSPNSKTLAVGTDYDPVIQLFSVKTGREKRRLLGHTHRVNHLAFSPSGRILTSASEDGSIKLWNQFNGRLLATLLVLPSIDSKNSNEWIIYTPDGYYNCSPGAVEFIRWQIGNKILPADRYGAEFQCADLLKRALN